MSFCPRTFLLGILIATVVLETPVSAQTPLSPGASLPSTPSLQRLDGTSVSPDALLGPTGTVFIFWSNECPWVQRYESRVRDLVSDFQEQGVRFVLVNANDAEAHPQESLEASRSHVQEKSYGATYVRDPTGDFARALGATRTPHAYVFDGGGTLVYVGAIDDGPSGPSRVETSYLREAVRAEVAGTGGSTQSQKAFGCTLKYPE